MENEGKKSQQLGGRTHECERKAGMFMNEAGGEGGVEEKGST